MVAPCVTAPSVSFAFVAQATIKSSYIQAITSAAGPFDPGCLIIQFPQNSRNLRMGTGGQTNAYNTTYNFTDNVPFLCVMTATIAPNGTYQRIAYINGTALTGYTDTIATYFKTLQLSNINIGGWDVDPGRTLFGSISSFMVFNNVLNTTNRQKVEGFLAWKWWGDGSILPTTHPYKYQPPVA